MTAFIDVTSDRGVPFRVVFYRDERDAADAPFPAAFTGEFYRGKAQVEFYDQRHPHTPFGQFTGGRYFAETLLEHPSGGLTLDGGNPGWSVDAATMAVVYAWLALMVGRVKA